MSKQAPLRSDLLALGLVVVTAVLAISLATYDRADPPSTLIYPPNAKHHNACGPIGAFVAHGLFSLLGLGAYYLVFSLGVVNVLLLVRREVTEPVLRSLGWIVSLVGLTTMAALAIPWLSPGPVIGAGGFVGATGRAVLEMHFASLGAYILVASLIAAGLFLCTDYLLLQLAAMLIGASGRMSWRAFSRAHEVYFLQRSSANLDDEDEYEDEDDDPDDDDGDDGPYEEEDEYEDEEEESDLRVVSRGSAMEDDEDEDLAAEDEEAETIAAVGKSGVASRLASALRIGKKPNQQEVIQQLEAADRAAEAPDYELPPMDLLEDSEPISTEEQEREIRRRAKILERAFRNFGYNVKVVEVQTGPVIAQYEVELERGLRVSKIASLADDLAIALRVPTVRVVAPIPGKNTVGIEVPNTDRQLVRLREVVEETNGRVRKMHVPIYLGKDVAGEPMVFDLATMPHLLIAGRTGTGKSVCLNTIIMSILMTRRPDEVRLLLIDPKMVELTPYSRLPHLMHPVITDMKKAEAVLEWAVNKMEERYALMAKAGVRHISAYNQLGEEELYERLKPRTEEERKQIPKHLPFLVMVADEMADLMMTAPKEVEGFIIRLAQKSRAVGIHLVLATQKPTVDVITGLIKSNLPARICFQVASKTDSRVVLDEMGADKLLGNGDLLFLWPGTSTLLRGQGAYVHDDEITKAVGFVGRTAPQFVPELVQLPAAGDAVEVDRRKDELYEQAIDVVVGEGRGSVSLLQRTLGIGYGRAARLIDFMAEDGIVGQYNGSQAREVVITPEQWTDMKSDGSSPASSGGGPSSGPTARRRNRIQIAPPHVIEEDDELEEPEDEIDDEEVEEEAVDEEDEYEYEYEEDSGEDEQGEYEKEECEEEEYEEDEYEDEESEEDEYQETA